MTTVLIVEDDAPLRRALRTSLHAHGFETLEASSGEEAVDHAASRFPEVVVLDLALPGIDGVETLRRMRSFTDVPVIVLSARDSQRDKIIALDAGADDYVTKPFDSQELFARLRAALRRSPRPVTTEPVIQAGDVEIDLARRLVRRDGEPVHLTRTELSLLEVLVTHPGKLLTHEFLLRRVWGPGYATESNYLRVYVRQLRRKLGDDAAAPRLILTEPGLGYRWIAGEE